MTTTKVVVKLLNPPTVPGVPQIKKKPEKHQGTMVNALLRMCLKRISATSWDYCYYKSHLFDTKRPWLKKTVCARHPWLWHGPGPGWLCYSIVRGQCKTFKFWTVKWALHLPPDLCKGKQHSWVVNACLLQEAGERNSHHVPGFSVPSSSFS